MIRRLAMVLAANIAIASLSVASAADSVTVTLATLNASGVSGTAVLTATGNQTQAVVTVTGGPSGASEPDHTHTGQCGATLGGGWAWWPTICRTSSPAIVSLSMSRATISSSSGRWSAYKLVASCRAF